jgi:hypothetical protein
LQQADDQQGLQQADHCCYKRTPFHNYMAKVLDKGGSDSKIY